MLFLFNVFNFLGERIVQKRNQPESDGEISEKITTSTNSCKLEDIPSITTNVMLVTIEFTDLSQFLLREFQLDHLQYKRYSKTLITYESIPRNVHSVCKFDEIPTSYYTVL